MTHMTHANVKSDLFLRRFNLHGALQMPSH